MEMKKEYLREYDAMEMLLEKVAKFGYKMRNLLPKISQIDINSEFLTTNTYLFLWKSF